MLIFEKIGTDEKELNLIALYRKIIMYLFEIEGRKIIGKFGASEEEDISYLQNIFFDSIEGMSIELLRNWEEYNGVIDMNKDFWKDHFEMIKQ